MHPDSGGTSQGIRNIIPELEKLGLHNEVVCLDDPSNQSNVKDPFLIIALGPAKGPWQYNAKLIPWLVDNLDRFDIIIINALWLYHGYAFRKALNQYKKLHEDQKNLKCPKFFVMPHGMLDPYFQKDSERKIKAIRNWIYWKLIESKLVNSADGVLFTCQSELQLAREPFRPYNPKREINIGYGTELPPSYHEDMKAAFLEKCPQVKDQPFILFLSRIHEKKGVDLLIEAYSTLLNEPGAFPKLIIAGPGLDSEYGKKMMKLVSVSKTLKDTVFFPGMLAGQAKWGAFYLCEAFILPSHQENFGIAVVEALACGKPVLISNQVNIWHEIVENNAGMVEEDTVSGVEKLLRRWHHLPLDEKKAIKERAYSCFLNNFSIHLSAKKFKELVIQESNS
ncbi:MAG: glycosyltransferase [Ferruginibacter sp.]